MPPPRMLARGAPAPGRGSDGERIAGAGILTEHGALPRAVGADEKRAGSLLDFHGHVLEHKRLSRLPPTQPHVASHTISDDVMSCHEHMHHRLLHLWG